MHKGTRTSGGNMSAELQQKFTVLLDEFDANVQTMAARCSLLPGFVRTMLPCSLVALLDTTHPLYHGPAPSRDAFFLLY